MSSGLSMNKTNVIKYSYKGQGRIEIKSVVVLGCDFLVSIVEYCNYVLNESC